MRKTLLAFSLLLFPSLTVTAASTSADETWLTSVAAAKKAAREQNRRILVDLYADWCGWCKELERKVFSTPQFRSFAKDFVLLRVDVEDRGEGSELQARFDATGLPTTLILDSSFVHVGQVRGFAPTADFIAMIRGEIERYDAFLAQYEKLRTSDDLQVLRQLAEELHTRGDGKRAAHLYERIRPLLPAGTAGAAWLQLMLADAHRLAEDFGRAETAMERARSIGQGAGDPELIERLDLLRYQIAQDRGDCKAAAASLERFLKDHPRSNRSSDARRTLAALRARDPLCA